MKFGILTKALLSTMIALTGTAAQASSLGFIECSVWGVRYGTGSENKPAPVLDEKRYTKQCALSADPEFGFAGECSFTVGRVKVFARTINTDIDMSTQIAPITVETAGDDGYASQTLWDARHNTNHHISCRIRR